MDCARSTTVNHSRLLWGTVLRRRDDGRWIYRQYTGTIEPTEFRVGAHQSF